MPWSPKQNKLFRAAEHNPAIAKKVGIKQSDAKRMAHEGIKKMAKGGLLDKTLDAVKAKNKEMSAAADDEGSESSKMATPPEAQPDISVVETKRNTFARAMGDRIRRGVGMRDSYKQGGPVKKKRTYYAASGGRVDVNDPDEAKEASTGKGEHKWQTKGKTKGSVVKMSSGGSVGGRGDGLAQRGKTKGRCC